MATLAEKMVSRFHKVNKLYNGTLNAIHFHAFIAIALDMSNNEVFTYTKAMQQPDSVQFIHESINHWEIVCRSTIPPRHKTIQAIWSLNINVFPVGASKNIRHACVPMVECNSGVSPTGRRTPPWSICSWSASSLPCVTFTAWNPSPLISSWHFLKPTSTQIFGWNFPQVLLLQNPTIHVPTF